MLTRHRVSVDRGNGVLPARVRLDGEEQGWMRCDAQRDSKCNMPMYKCVLGYITAFPYGASVSLPHLQADAEVKHRSDL